jgi:uncharacterized membrane protein YgcG
VEVEAAALGNFFMTPETPDNVWLYYLVFFTTPIGIVLFVTVTKRVKGWWLGGVLLGGLGLYLTRSFAWQWWWVILFGLLGFYLDYVFSQKGHNDSSDTINHPFFDNDSFYSGSSDSKGDSSDFEGGDFGSGGGSGDFSGDDD